MDKPKTTTEAQVEPAAPQPQAKKRYEPPAIIYHAPLEATAGACDDYPGKAMGEPLCSTVNS